MRQPADLNFFPIEMGLSFEAPYDVLKLTYFGAIDPVSFPDESGALYGVFL
jgi:hypothetical protein